MMSWVRTGNSMSMLVEGRVAVRELVTVAVVRSHLKVISEISLDKAEVQAFPISLNSFLDGVLPVDRGKVVVQHNSKGRIIKRTWKLPLRKLTMEHTGSF